MNKILNLLLIGTAGNGKSATGNSILRQEFFATSADFTDVEILVKKGSGTFEDTIFNIVDVPGIDTDNKSEDVFKTFQTLVKEAFSRSKDGFSAFILVLKYGNRFTRQEHETLKLLKSTFGNDVIKNHVICVLTHGDMFKSDMELEDEISKFDVWCRQQEGAIQKLFQECNYRCVLFDNKTKDQNIIKEQLKKVIEFSCKTLDYTENLYNTSEEGRMNLLEEIKAPEINKQIMATIDEFRSEMKLIELQYKDKKMDQCKRLENLLERVKDYKNRLVVPKALSQKSFNPQVMLAVLQSELEVKIKLLGIPPLKEEETENINILLLGTTGNGKSSVGNTILGGAKFPVSSSSRCSESKVLEYSRDFENKTIKVVELPGMETGNSIDGDLRKFQQYLDNAFSMCEEGFRAIILVLKYEKKFTYQENHMLNLIKRLLGKYVIQKHIICVFSCGDMYEEDYGEFVNFTDWCKKQDEPLFQKCNYRCVLFNNRTKDQQQLIKQREALLNETQNVQQYTMEHYTAAKEKQQHLIEKNLEDKCIQDTKDFLIDALLELEKLDTSSSDFQSQRGILKDKLRRLENYEKKIKAYEKDHQSLLGQIKKVKNALIKAIERKVEYRQPIYRNDNTSTPPFVRHGIGRETTVSSVSDTRTLLPSVGKEKVQGRPKNNCCSACSIL